MTALARLEAKRLLMRVIGEAERRLRIEAGGVLSDRRHTGALRARQIIMLIGVEEMGLAVKPLARMLRRDHSTVVRGARKARELIGQEPWRSLHAALVAFLEAGCPLAAPEPGPDPFEAMADEPMAAPAPLHASRDDGAWPDPAACARQDRAFVAAMRRAHPEREREIRRAPA